MCRRRASLPLFTKSRSRAKSRPETKSAKKAVPPYGRTRRKDEYNLSAAQPRSGDGSGITKQGMWWRPISTALISSLSVDGARGSRGVGRVGSFMTLRLRAGCHDERDAGIVDEDQEKKHNGADLHGWSVIFPVVTAGPGTGCGTAAKIHGINS